ncbi:MAG: VOC family protein, partial [Candidatus Hodarchaeales archaeon]
MINNFVHIDIGVKDLERTREFYGALFSWRLYKLPEMPDVLFFEADKEGDSIEGAFSVKEKPITTGSVVLYVNVADIDATLSKIQ